MRVFYEKSENVMNVLGSSAESTNCAKYNAAVFLTPLYLMKSQFGLEKSCFFLNIIK